MGIYRSGSGYVIDFRFRGRRLRRYTKLKTKAEAREAEALWRAQLSRGEVGLLPVPRLTFAEFVERDYLPWYGALRPNQASTIRRRVVALAAPLRFFGEMMLTDIGPGEVETYRGRRIGQHSRHTGRPVGPATVNRETDALRSVFDLVVRRRMMAANPVSGVGKLREPDPPQRVLSFAEERKYLAVARGPVADVAVLMLHTGMRPDEIFRLRPEDVNLAEGWLRVVRGKTRAARRFIPLDTEASAVLARRLGWLTTREWLFPARHDQHRSMGKVHGSHHRAVRRAKVPWFRLYDLRHTFATRAVQSGMDLPTLGKILGHARPTMLFRYAHPGDDHARSVMERLSAYRRQKSGIQAGDSPENSPAGNGVLQ